ncbi:MAG: ABC transporter permease, partial [Actinomycetota bacterium]
MPPETETAVRADDAVQTSTVDNDDLAALSAGLDRLQSDTEQTTSQWRDLMSKLLPPIGLLLVLLAIWQLYIVIADPRPDKAPSPLAVAGALSDAWASGRL